MSSLKSKMGQLCAIKSGRGIQYILNRAYEILGNPVAMYDLTEYKLLACAENIVTDDPFLSELITQGAFSKTTMAFCKEEQWFDFVANDRTVSYITNDKLKYDRILGELFNKDNILVAGLVVVACDRSFGDDDLELVETLCKVLSKELSKSEFYQDYGHTFRDTLVMKLIEGSIQDKGYYSPYVADLYEGLKTNIFQDKGYYSPYVADLYEGLKTNIYLAVADVAQHNPEHIRLTYFRELFMQTQKAFKYAIYNDYIVMILSTDEAALNVKNDFKKLYKVIADNNICVGVSAGFENLYNLREHYFEAVNALDYGLKTNNSLKVFLYDGL